jgi:VWFA-related protein
MPSPLASVLVATLLVASSAPITAAQQVTTAPDLPTQPSTIRSTTRLVQVSVVALDSHGNPVTGLTKNDFTLTDEHAPQSISVFNSESPAPASPTRVLPANLFTNRYDLKGQDPGAVTVILFDALNTSSQDQSYARKQILKFLQSLQPQDHVAIYALTTKLLILHDFTQDVTALVNAVNHFTPKETAAFDASNTPLINLVDSFGDAGFARLQNNVNNANGLISDQNIKNSVITTANALQAIADHVAVVPGRKSLVWVSGGFPLQIGINNINSVDRDSLSFATSPVPNGAETASDNPLGGSNNPNQLPKPDRDQQITATPDVFRAIRALNRANISIYPIDVHGVELSAGMGAENVVPNSTLASGGFFGRQNRLDTFKLLADRTGGVAFYGNNDIREGVRRAFDDGRYAYTLGFYPDHNTWDGKFREIKVQVKTPGVQLRYRKGYFATPELSDSAAAVKLALQDVAISPLEATNLGMIVMGKSVGPLSDARLELRVALDPKQFLLQVADGHRTGALDMMFVQDSPTGEVLAAEEQHFAMNFDEKQFVYMAKAGLILERHVTVSPQSADLRVIVRDSGSGALGSVIIPIKALYPNGVPVHSPSEPAVPPTPAKPS